MSREQTVAIMAAILASTSSKMVSEECVNDAWYIYGLVWEKKPELYKDIDLEAEAEEREIRRNQAGY